MDNITEIDDGRTQKDYNVKTFSGYKKLDVSKSLMNSLIDSNVEASIYWSAELICSGHYDKVWTILIEFYCKYIHIGNVNIAIYMRIKYMEYLHIKETTYKIFLLNLRNNEKLRKMFAEIIFILCNSIKKHLIKPPKLSSDAFIADNIKLKLKATEITFASDVIKPYDPKEYIIPINEIGYHIKNMDATMACYWLEWAIMYNVIYKDAFKCEKRDYIFDKKFKEDIIWLIWDVIFNEVNKRNNKFLFNVVNALLYFFCIDYTKTTPTNKKYIIYFVINMLCENVIWSDEQVIGHDDKKRLYKIVGNIDLIYKEIKKNEEKNIYDTINLYSSTESYDAASSVI